ncbi:MAG: methylglyoxal synthase [Gomphosphaeria aponina SAG 52.96 = DSM 107014]|uniref:Methylglyoxal synthase n=1 Tax=Gomphosphaeria aponina SAG 52.96 = DSM 107014 TaxID=1521640 RepID=A0A941GSY3_9CHRO|nr:methylglyoxal synthase [Gomphosphaeria aponina SAG 52.96 = DSM 107014]
MSTIAFIAHNRKKQELVNFLKQHAKIFSRYNLIATENTGWKIEQGTELQVEKVLPGTLGGEIQIAAKVATGEIKAVFFLVDPYPDAEEPDFTILSRICHLHNITLATNIATAEKIVVGLTSSRFAHLIFNPVAGQNNSQQDLLLIRKSLEQYIELKVCLTTPEITAEELTQDAIASESEIIIASGGDGTVSAVAGEIMGSNIALGIIPRGTANAFAVALGIPTTILGACDIIIAGATRQVDAARCQGRPLILLAGIGYEAETIEKADRQAKNRWGQLAYIMAGVNQVTKQEPFETYIEIDGVESVFTAEAVTIANAAPTTSILAQGFGELLINDGLLEVIIVLAQESKIQAMQTLTSLFGAGLFGTATQREDIVCLRAKQIKVTTYPPQKVVLDGEIIGSSPIEIECIPDALNVIAPILVMEKSTLDMSGKLT